MKYNALHDAGRFSKLRRNRKRWQKVVSVMASIVVFCTTYALILPAITMEQPDTYCGLENHIHGPECYEKVLTCDHAGDDVVEATPMANVTEGHTHDETCYEEIKNLICEQEEVVGHKHDSSCETLICSLEETSGHSHSDACYEIQYETKTWTEEVTVNDGEELTCTSTEEGHEHDGSCYTAKSHTETVEHTEQVEVGRVLTCTTPESAPHSHDASCYQMVCTQEEVEGHTHTDECYTVEQGELICEIPEVTEAPETTEPEVTDPAEPAHEHSDACYEEKLICGCEIEHEHVADCYIEPPYEPADDEALVCELEEHKHDDACLIAETGELICDLEEHSHDENCYEQLPAFEMWLPLDADIDLDVYTEKHEYIDEDGLYGVTVYAKPDTFDLPVTLEVELLEEDDDRYVNALDVLAAQVEETEEAEEEIVDEAADELAAIDEVTPENTLPEEPAEPTSEAPVAEEEVVEEEIIEEEIIEEEIIEEEIIEEEVIEEEITAQPALTGEEGMIAFDIHFVDEDGDEVQPLEPVYVHIQAMGLLPEDVDLSTVTVQHIREEQPATFWGRMMDMIPFVDETVYIPEVVADMIDEDLGWIDFEPNMDDDEIYDVNTAFEVDGFSTFTITWNNSTTNRITVTVVDTNGEIITYENLSSTNFTQADDAKTVAEIAPNIPGYEFDHAYIVSNNNNITIQRLQWHDGWSSDRWQYSTSATGNFSDLGSSPVYFVYELKGQSIEFTVEGVTGTNKVTAAIPYDEVHAIEDVVPDIDKYVFVMAKPTGDDASVVTHIRYLTSGENKGWGYSTDGGENWIVSETAPAITLEYKENVSTVVFRHALGDTYTQENIEIEHDQWYTLTDYVDSSIDGNFKEAHLTDANGVKIQAIMFSNSTNSWYYRADGATKSIGAEAPVIYMEYTEEETFTGVQPTGVTVNVFNYGSKINDNHTLRFNGANSLTSGTSAFNQWTGDSNVYAGIVQKKLVNGYPVLALGNNGESLDYLFGGATNSALTDTNLDAQNLFQVDEDGYYYYDSAENFAIFDENGDFRLYYRPADPSGSNDIMFAPYSTIEEIEIGPFDDEGYHLGVHVSGPFYMPKDGMVNGKPMVFEFSGDDDVWVFIDGMLILDIGGIHLSSDGSIDFATGKINNPTTDNNVTLPATIKDAVIAALGETEGNKWVEENMHQTADGNWIFNDYTEHQLDFFYIERGGGHSNCKIKFNLPTIPKNSLMIGKELSVIQGNNTNAPADFTTFVKDSLTYQFKVLNADKSSILEEIKNKPYTVMKDGAEVRSGTVGEDGIITLKADEIAVFAGVFSADQKIEYYVQEIMPTSLKGQYQGVGYEVVGAGGTTTEQNTTEETPTGSKFTTFISNKLESQKQSTTVMFNNKVLFEKLSVLTISKEVVGGTVPQRATAFNVQIKTADAESGAALEEMTEGTAYSFRDAKGNLSTKYVEANGVIKLKHGESATFLVMAGTKYSVEEIVGSNAAYTESYMLNNETLAEGVIPTGSIDAVNSVHSVEITNRFPTTGIQLTKKVINTSDATDTDGSFTFKIGPLPETVDTTLVKFTFSPAQSQGDVSPKFTENGQYIEVVLKHNQSVVIEGIEAGNYTVEELYTDGYTVKWESTNGTPSGTGVTVAVAENKTTSVTCTNTTGYALPSTGGIGTTLYTMSGMAMMSAALVGGYGLRRKRERGSEE